MHILVIRIGHVALNGAVLAEQVEGIQLDFAALAGENLLAQAGIPKYVLLVEAGGEARVSLMHEVGGEADARAHNPVQPQTRDLGKVVRVELRPERVAHKILGRRSRGREIKLGADVGTQREARPEGRHPGVVQPPVHEARRLGEAGVGAQVHIGFNGLDGYAVAQQRAQGVLLAQVDGLHQLAAGGQAHFRRTIRHHRGVAGGHQRAVRNRVLGIGAREYGEETASHFRVRGRITQVGRMLKFLPQRGITNCELQRVRVVHHSLQLVHAGRVGISAVVQAQVFLLRETVVQIGIGQHVHKRVAADAGPRKLRVAEQFRVLAREADTGLVLGHDVSVGYATRLR